MDKIYNNLCRLILCVRKSDVMRRVFYSFILIDCYSFIYDLFVKVRDGKDDKISHLLYYL